MCLTRWNNQADGYVHVLPPFILEYHCLGLFDVNCFVLEMKYVYFRVSSLSVLGFLSRFILLLV